MAQMNKAREALVNEFTKLLENDVNYTWKKGWKTDSLSPENGKTGKRYRGVNQLLLTLNAHKKGYTDNRWFTFTQASEMGYQIRKGAEGIPIEFWSYYDIKEKKNISREEYDRIRTEEPDRDMEKDFRIVSKVFYVFNAADVEGLEPLPEQKRKAEKPAFIAKEFSNNLRDSLNVVVEPSENGRAYYDVKNDWICIPKKDDFYSEYAFYSTLLHEMAHSTGSKDRLDRDMTGRFGSENYAKEELRAEISSCFLSAELGISTEEDNQEHVDNHKAYVSSWLKIIKEKPEELFRAIKDAEAITDYMTEKGNLSKVQERYADLQPETIGRIFYYNFAGEIEKTEDYADWEEFQQAVGRSLESGENIEAMDLYECPDDLLKEFRKESQQRQESFEKQIERIGKWEKEHNIPSVNRVTSWAGDYAMYELQSGIDYREIEKREIQIMQSKEKEERTKNASQIPVKEKIPAAIESTEDYMDFHGFTSMAEPKGIKYRPVIAKEGNLMPYPDDTVIFYNRKECEEYIRQQEELEAISYDDIIAAVFAQKAEIQSIQKKETEDKEDVPALQEAAVQPSPSPAMEPEAQAEILGQEENRHVEELVNLLKENDMEEQSNNVTEIFLRLDEIGQNLVNMLEEAKGLYQQIEKESIPEQVKETVKEVYASQEKGDLKLKEQVEELKGNIRSRSQQIAGDFKVKGKEALYQITEFFNLKDRLFLMYAKTEQRIAATRKTIEKLESFGTGIREAGQRTANAFRSLIDKNEVDYSSKDRKFSKTDILIKPFHWREKSYEFIARQLDAAIQTVENIGRIELSSEIESHVSDKKAELQDSTEDIAQALNNRETSHYGIGSDVSEVLKPYSTEELIQYFSDVIMHQDNGEHLRQYLEEQIINHEIEKEQEKVYSMPSKAAAR